MGTNYYLKTQVCPHCKRAKDTLHIGKSSAGWCFGLCLHPDHGVNSLDDWQKLFNAADSAIEDDYGEELTPDNMLGIITKRGRKDIGWSAAPMGYESWDAFFARNDAEKGPNGLLRHSVGRLCVAHGDGTWDYLVGEFS